ncbi:MAG: AAA family ATPase [Methanomassiliicoccales archaeon]|nr:MAG: AAA family ATPase [Methanomassiliicoccales archaeon]
MASKFECPRCGSGIKPGDYQCDRCGEILRKIEKKAPPRQAAQVDEPSSTRPHADINVDEQRRLDLLQKERDLQIKERQLAEKESRLKDMMESLEKDAQHLDDSIALVENQKAVLQEKQESILEREELLLDLMQRVEAGLAEIAGYIEASKKGAMNEDDLGAVLELKRRFTSTYEPERRRVKKGIIDFDVQDLSRVIELEAMLRAAEEKANKYRLQLEEKTELTSEESVSVIPDEKLMEEISSQLDEQIGKGCADTQIGLPIQTRMDKMDSILGGGIPTGHVILVTGPPGSMKSTLAYSLVYNASIAQSTNSLYISLEQSSGSLLRQMERLNMPAHRIGDKMMVVDMVGLRKTMADEQGDWRSILLRYVKNIYSEWRFKFFVLDSLGAFKSITSHEYSREDLHELFEWFKELGITVFLIAEAGAGDAAEIMQEAYLSDGVIEMRMKEFGDSRVQRWMRVVKMRGMNIDTRFYAMLHNGDHFIFTLPMVETNRGP